MHNNSFQANHSPPAEGAEKSIIADVFIKIKPHSGGGVLSNKCFNSSMTTTHLNTKNISTDPQGTNPNKDTWKEPISNREIALNNKKNRAILLI